MHSDTGLQAACNRLITTIYEQGASARVYQIARELLPSAREEMIGMLCADIDNRDAKGKESWPWRIAKDILMELAADERPWDIDWGMIDKDRS